MAKAGENRVQSVAIFLFSIQVWTETPERGPVIQEVSFYEQLTSLH